MSLGTSALEGHGADACHTPLRLHCRVQHYAWGDADFIPSLLGIENRDRQPFAELWMGAHPDLPSQVDLEGNLVPLDELITAMPATILGPSVAQRFGGRLPYLFKVLSAAAPLSIQAHPSKESATEGYARENAAGVPRSAPQRNYRDENHKPELIAALTDFYGLRGFRPLAEISVTLEETPEFRQLMPDFEPTPAALKALYDSVMNLPQHRVDSILDPLVRRLEQVDRATSFTRDDREYWVLRASRECTVDGQRDRGLFSIYLLNLVHLKPGEAMFLPAGVLHAYLEGSGIEIMANSNNVLRGGLTRKHVDVAELLANVTFRGEQPEILQPTRLPGGHEWVYKTPVDEFELRRIELNSSSHENGAEHSAELLILALAGHSHVTATSESTSLELTQGNVFLVPHGVAYTIESNGPVTLFKATLPTTGASC